MVALLSTMFLPNAAAIYFYEDGAGNLQWVSADAYYELQPGATSRYAATGFHQASLSALGALYENQHGTVDDPYAWDDFCEIPDIDPSPLTCMTRNVYWAAGSSCMYAIARTYPTGTVTEFDQDKAESPGC